MSSAKNLLLLFLLLACIQTAKADWTKQTSNTFAWLHDVYFTNDQTGWIAGSGGTFLTTTDGGKTWTKSKKFIEDNIRQVYFTDQQTGWLLCERNLFSLGANSPSYLLKTNDGGASWKRIEFTDNQRKRITKFFFAKSGLGLAVGEGGAFFAMQDDGETWKRSRSPIRYLMFDGIFTDDAHGVVVGAGGSILFTEDAGLSWNKSSVFGNSETKLNSVFFLNQKNGWTVGSQGKIFQTVNGGKTWREQKSNVAKDLTDVFFNNSAEGWAIGDEGTILYTATAGNVWTIVNTKVGHKLEKVFFIGKKGFAVGFGGTILSYDKTDKNANSSLAAPQLRIRN
jgi:photosystem II stability/assembly factor-like uncharacterized protein